MYSYAGVVLRSEIPLELPAADDGAEGPIVEVRRRSDRVAELPEYRSYAVRGRQADRSVALGQVDDEWVAWLPPYLTARIATSAIDIEPFPGISDDKLDEHIVGNVLPFWLSVTGRWAFHGSAASRPGLGCLAMLGPTRSGKSTTAALLAADGWELVADDTITGRIVGATVVLEPTSDTLHLRGKAAALAESPALRQHGVDPEGRVRVKARHRGTSVSLDRLLFLRAGAGADRAPSPVPDTMLVKYLLDNSRIAAWIDVDLRTREFAVATEIAGRVRGFEIAGPDGFSSPDDYAAYVRRVVGPDGQLWHDERS